MVNEVFLDLPKSFPLSRIHGRWRSGQTAAQPGQRESQAGFHRPRGNPQDFGGFVHRATEEEAQLDHAGFAGIEFGQIVEGAREIQRFRVLAVSALIAASVSAGKSTPPWILTTYPTISSIAAPGSHFTCIAALPSRNETS